MANKLILSTVFIFLTPALVFSDDNAEIQPDKKLHEKCLYPTIQVSAEMFVNNKKMPGEVFGTGVILRSEKIGDDYWNTAITAAHVVAQHGVINPFGIAHGNAKMEIKRNVKVAIYKDWSTFVKYEQYPVHVYKAQNRTDLAILIFRTQRKMHTADVDCESKLFIGTEVMRVGCGLGDQPRIDFGRVTSLNPTFEAVKNKGRTRLSIHTVPGDSGGGIFHNYKLKGIMSSIRALGRLPVFEISYMSKISNLSAWNKAQNNCLDFVYKETSLPIIARNRMWFMEQTVNKNDFIHSDKYAIPLRTFQ
tara:strand:- start:505 stop:1419 length:915 start_codon:yes stop_codon:yes gene_type:complete